MKKLLELTVLSGILALGTAASATNSISLPTDNGIHIIDSVANPSFGKLQGANHYFTLHVEGRVLTQLLITLPNGINSIEDIEVTDQFGNLIETTALIDDQEATVTFAEPIVAETMLSVKLKDVQIDQWNNIWLYQVSGTVIEPQIGNLPIGTVRIHTDAN